MTDPYMRRALELAHRAAGSTSPNPPVGAVLVKDGQIVGEGFTQAPGKAHAEIMALGSAGPEARGSTLYVTLEPCSNWGRTPPCTDALIQSGVSDIHIALTDPNPRENGKGIMQLRRQGKRVVVGEGAEEAAELAEPHAKYTKTGLPFVTLALDLPNSVLSRLEASSDAIIRDTTETSSAAEAGLGSPVGLHALIRNEHIDLSAADSGMTGSLTAKTGVAEGQVDIAHLLAELARREIISCLVDGSSRLTTTFLKAKAVDRVVLPIGAKAPPGFVLHRRLEAPLPHAVLRASTQRE